MTKKKPPLNERLVRLVKTTLGTEIVCETPVMRYYTGVGDPLRSAANVAKMMGFMRNLPVEEFWVILLNGKNFPFGACMVSRGTMTTSLLHPREVFGPALRLSAAGVIVVHNHPTGDPAPSTEDREVTARLVEAGQLIGIPLLDHVVIGDFGHASCLFGGA